jgi:hypothetical protein
VRWIALATAATILLVALGSPRQTLADSEQARTFSVDVSFGLPYYQNNVDPTETVIDPNAFSPGDTFVQDGVIYPEGTIRKGTTDFDPRSALGAIGKYKMRGTWTTDLADFKQATERNGNPNPEMAFATEIFSFANNRGIILADGIVPNAYFSSRRVVLGGTNHFVGYVGEVHEENIGENALGFCNLRVTFKIRKTDSSHDQ